MINRFSVLFPIFFAAILAFISYWVQVSVENESEKRGNKLSNSPDYFLTNFKTIQTESNGSIHFILSANEMTHFAQDDTTRLKKPLFIRYKNNLPSSKIEGRIGLVSTNGEEVQIIDNVKVIRLETETKPKMELFTDQLTVLPNKDQAFTKRPVRITQDPKTVVNAIGMNYDKKNGIMTLLGKVRVHYEKPVKKTNLNVHPIIQNKNLKK
ncbi:LPS export ABC transporter periplasmic protein LptC [Candidatus Methylopumilus universalis]|uniref:LPS export ABC transporter periplasmic protein LptC n=1 Tax=Candidatus Methylopumilus universalis TaxID=2588536 RepID=A0ABX5VS22_9PROT|nr:LPS export ABC transporter periplasmic protein LptC [Candidatus Methylopumilus universalis]QDC50578.1 LPS export ABC transporter periplasmic protein LptC [Candidatus Methylopumilus universalis]QDC60712.1 LPS export ABC transporter periplasmic protein LptC [Candidatus Methylopumilus universalis]